MLRYVRLLLLFSCATCYADIPLSLDELLTNKGKIKFETSIVYSNTDNKQISSGEPIIIETGNGFISLPTSVGETKINSDTFVSSIGLRYGLTKHIEPYVRLSYINNQQRISDHQAQNHRLTQHNWNDAVIGFNYKFGTFNDVVEFISYLETSAYERYREHNVNFKTYATGLTGYYSIDPIVLSLTLSYQLALSRTLRGITYQPSHYFTINPMLGFSVNEKITLLSGLQWFVRRSEKVAGVKQGLNQTSTALQFGIGYGITRDVIVSLNANIKASGQPSSDIRLNFSYIF